MESTAEKRSLNLDGTNLNKKRGLFAALASIAIPVIAKKLG